jgi:hypothetical protein
VLVDDENGLPLRNLLVGDEFSAIWKIENLGRFLQLTMYVEY